MMEPSINWDVDDAGLEAGVCVAERDHGGYDGSERCIGSQH